MAVKDRDTRSSQNNRTGGRFNPGYEDDEPALGDLLRRFGQDATALVRQEIALAKLELRESAKSYASNAARMGVAAAVGLVGALTLTAFLVIALGDLINNYWLSALIVSIAFLGAAAVLARGAIAHMKQDSLAPRETVRTLKEDQEWAKREVADFKHRLKA